jgi:Icc-related predicted phosphoesterase
LALTARAGQYPAVRVKVISDLHGAVDHIPEAAADCDRLVVLGDLINILDYRTMDGILVDIFGREPVAQAASLRAQGKFHEARATIRESMPEGIDLRGRIAELASEQYRAVFDALPDGTIVTFGNVDIPDVLRPLLPEMITFVETGTFELAGLRWGIVGGGVRTPLGIPGEVGDEEHQARFDALGPVDVVGTHMPPRVPWFCYDTVAQKFEPGSTALIGYILEHRPRFSLFGHVHQPLASQGLLGHTQCVNVGHCQADGRGWTYEGS